MRPFVILGVLGLGSIACTDTPPGRPPVAVEEWERLLEENARLRERIVELEAGPVVGDARPAPICPEVEDLRGELLTLSRNLATASSAASLYQGRAAEYEAGLARCVGELNALQGQRRIVVGEGRRAAAPVTPSRQPMTPERVKSLEGVRDALQNMLDARPERLRPVRTLSVPDVDVAGESIVVSARLYNPEPVERQVRVEIAVTVDGVVRDSETQGLTIPASGAHAVAATFHLRSYRGTIAGRVRVLE